MKKSRTEYRAGQGLRSKDLKDQSDQNQVLTCEDSRKAAHAPLVAQPTAVPVPLANAPVQVQDAAVAARVTKDGSVEEDVGRVVVRLLLERLGDEMRVFPESLERLGVETDVTCLLETLQLFFSADRVFTFRKHRFEVDLGEINFGECKRTLVLFRDRPTFADEGDRVESGGAADGDDLGNALDDTSTVLQECSELQTCVTGVVDDLLQDGAIDGVPVRIVHQDGDGVQNLTL